MTPLVTAFALSRKVTQMLICYMYMMEHVGLASYQWLGDTVHIVLLELMHELQGYLKDVPNTERRQKYGCVTCMSSTL